jgi:hypothetical protein
MWEKVTTMKTHARTSAIAFSGLLLVSALAIFVPTATAQADQKVVVDSQFTQHAEGPVLPDTGQAVLKLKTTVTVSVGTGCFIPIKVTWSRGAIPSYSTMIFNPSSASAAFTGEQNQPLAASPKTAVFNTDITITVTRDAPAFKDDTYEVKIKVEAGQVSGGGTCNIQNPSDTSATDVVKNGYFPLTQINPSTLYIKSGQNKKVVFPVDIVNLGNGPTRVKIDLTPAGKNKLDSMNAGGEVRLETRAGKGASAQYKNTRNVEVQTPHSNGYTNSIYSFNAKFTSSYDGPTQGTPTTDETSVTFTVQVQGVYVPGFEPFMLIAALGIALVGMSRLNRKN